LPPAPKVVEKRPKLVERNTAVVLEKHESRINDFMKVLDTVAKDRQNQQKVELDKRQKEYKKVCFKLFNESFKFAFSRSSLRLRKRSRAK
jgi:hypothetical protein